MHKSEYPDASLNSFFYWWGGTLGKTSAEAKTAPSALTQEELTHFEGFLKQKIFEASWHSFQAQILLNST